MSGHSQLRVHLYRDSFDTPWGFRLQGGKDLRQPLSVQRVFSNSPAEGELQRGDVLVSINNKDANTLTHKNAQDIIKFGGGQIELIVNRPPVGTIPIQVQVIKPNQPHAPVIKKAQPIQQAQPRATVKQEFRPQPIQYKSAPTQQTKPAQMPPPRAAGHQPRTIRQLGGGGPDFGSDFTRSPGQYASPASHRPVDSGAMMNRVQESLDARVYSPKAEQYLGQSPFDNPVAQPYTPGPPEEPEEEDYEFIPVNERRKAFTKADASRPQGKKQVEQVEHVEDVEEGYEYGTVTERRHMFMNLDQKARPSRKKVIRSVKAPRQMAKSSGPSFGTDYTQVPAAPRPAPQQRAPRPVPVNVQPQPVQTWQPPNAEIDTTGGSWSGSLRSSGPKPWELDLDYQQQPAVAQPVHEKPRKKQPPRSVTYQDMPQKQAPVFSPTQTPVIEFSGGEQDGPRVVHLQYNSPMGMYSRSNIKETLTGQTAGIVAEQQSAPAPAPAPAPTTPGDRDWNQSAVYRMLHEDGPPPKPAGYGLSQKPAGYGLSQQASQAPQASTVQVKLQQPQQPIRPDIDDEVGVSEF